MNWWRSERFAPASRSGGGESRLRAVIRSPIGALSSGWRRMRERIVLDHLALAGLMRQDKGRLDAGDAAELDSALAHSLWSVFINPGS